MISESIKTLIRKLIVKTNSKQANWKPSSGENSYQLRLTSGTITVDAWFDQSEDTEYMGVSIYNNSGDRIENIYIPKMDEENYELLMELHNAVNESYFRTDETIKGLLDEIDNNGDIGHEIASDDDLPF